MFNMNLFPSILEPKEWKVDIVDPGWINVEAKLPATLLNARNELYGGFTGTYIDTISLMTARTLYSENDKVWFPTVNMRIDYFSPVKGPAFKLEGFVINNGKSTCLVSTTFYDQDDNKLVYAITTLRKLIPSRES